MQIKVTRHGWFGFEGFGRPYDGWYITLRQDWRWAGRAFTKRGARRKAVRAALASYENRSSGQVQVNDASAR